MRRLEKTIEEIGWTKSVPKFAKSDMVGRAFDAMSREAHDCVLILDGESLAGIFTSRDFLNRVAADRKDPQNLPLGDVMTASPRTLRPRDGVAFAINWMAIEGFRNVPIVDDAGAAVAPSGKYVSEIQVANGTINITYGGQANANIVDGILSLRPRISANDDVIWLCGYNEGDGVSGLSDPSTPSDAGITNIAPKYVPASCRDQG